MMVSYHKTKNREVSMITFKTKYVNLIVSIGIALAMLGMTYSTATAEVKTVRLAKQFGLGYLPLIVMEQYKLIEKHAKAAGLGNINVTWSTFGGGAAMNDALISGNLDFPSGGVGPLIKIWAKSKGILDVKGVAAINAMPLFLNTRNPNVKSIRDLTNKDRIALPAVKVSIQAVILQMAAAKTFGEKNYDKLDHLTVSMKHPDALIALLSGRSEIDTHLTSPPYEFQELEDPSVHRVFSSYDILGGPHTFNNVWATSKFHKNNPKTYAAVFAALNEAMDIINKDKRAAAELYVKATRSKLSVDFVYKIITDPSIEFTTVPLNTMKFAKFMYKIGAIKIMPKSWKDMFFPEIYDKQGS